MTNDELLAFEHEVIDAIARGDASKTVHRVLDVIALAKDGLEAKDHLEAMVKQNARLLEARRQRLVARIDAILWYAWDPIGVHAVGGPRDEYSHYITVIAAVIGSEEPYDLATLRLTKMLRDIRVEFLGLPTLSDFDHGIACALVSLRFQ